MRGDHFIGIKQRSAGGPFAEHAAGKKDRRSRLRGAPFDGA